jgi:hypothetical protein
MGTVDSSSDGGRKSVSTEGAAAKPRPRVLTIGEIMVRLDSVDTVNQGRLDDLRRFPGKIEDAIEDRVCRELDEAARTPGFGWLMNRFAIKTHKDPELISGEYLRDLVGRFCDATGQHWVAVRQLTLERFITLWERQSRGAKGSDASQDQQWITVDEAISIAKRLQNPVSRDTLRRRGRDKREFATIEGEGRRSYLIEKGSFVAWIESQRRKELGLG